MKNRNGKYTHNGRLPLWDTALPLGNGKLGCLIYGDGDLRLSVDRIDLWDNRNPPEVAEEGFTYDNMIETGKNNWAEHQRLFDRCYSHPYPTKLTAGRLAFLGLATEHTQFCLDMTEAKAEIGTEKGRLEFFMDAVNFIGVGRVPNGLPFELQAPMYLSKPENEGGLGYPQGKLISDGEFTYTVQRTAENSAFGILVFRKSAKEQDELFFTVWAGADDGAVEEEKEKLFALSQKGFDGLFVEHIEYWKNYYAISTLSTGEREFDDYYLTAQYLFASTSRKGGLPMALQGVWTADNDELPPWKGDYHADVNLQMCYEHYMKAGRFEEGKVLCDYLWEKRNAFREFAKKFHGVEGILIPGVFTMEGVPLGGWSMFTLNPSAGVWLIKCFEEYYAYTGDEAFFAECAYPFLTEYADTTAKILIEDENGYLRYRGSASPEYHEGVPEAYLASQSNFDLSVLKYLFTTVARYARKVGDTEKAKHYAEILAKFKDYDYNEDDGSLRICKEEDFAFSHRHFSHLLAICPLHLFDAERDREMILASIAKLEKYGSYAWVGFSFTCMGELCAYIGEGNRAYRYLRAYLEAYVAENGFHLNGDYKHYGYGYMDYRPFTLEAVFEYCKALQDMFLACDDGVIIPFPAIPDQWEENELKFTDFRVHGGVKVSATRKDGKINQFSVNLPKEATLCVKNVFGEKTLTFICEQEKKTVVCERGENFAITLPNGRWRLDLLK